MTAKHAMDISREAAIRINDALIAALVENQK
jgi:hypothetical protein